MQEAYEFHSAFMRTYDSVFHNWVASGKSEAQKAALRAQNLFVFRTMQEEAAREGREIPHTFYYYEIFEYRAEAHLSPGYRHHFVERTQLW
jgi:hypothetical protein